MINKLAINGGEPAVKNLPSRQQFDEEVLRAVQSVFERSWETGRDFGFQGEFEERYCQAFSAYQGGGYTDAVCSGSVALYVLLRALNLKSGKEVIVPPVTDPGGVMPVIEAGLRPVVCDSQKGKWTPGASEIQNALTEQTVAVIVNHAAGVPMDLSEIRSLCDDKHLLLIEDCSQAHGAKWQGQKVGTFGHAAIFSTMFSKTHATGGCGGLVFTTNEDIYKNVRRFADRGKDFFRDDFDPKDARQNLMPSMNFNQNELASAIGFVTLQRLDQTIKRRQDIVHQITKGLESSKLFSSYSCAKEASVSPFFHTILVHLEVSELSKAQIVKALEAEGVPLNGDYRQLVSEWPWMEEFGAKGKTPHVEALRDASFNLLFHEKFTDEHVAMLLEAFAKLCA